MEKIGSVYAIRLKRTGKIYIGSTENLERRLETHISKLRNHKHPCKAMQDDFDKFGGELEYSVLFHGHAEKMELLQIEHTFMTLLGTRDPERGYNDRDNSEDFKFEHVLWNPAPKAAIVRTIRSETRQKQEPIKAIIHLSEKQKALAEKIAALPEKLQDKFTDKVDGAIMALDLMAEAQAEAEKEGDKSG